MRKGNCSMQSLCTVTEKTYTCLIQHCISGTRGYVNLQRGECIWESNCIFAAPRDLRIMTYCHSSKLSIICVSLSGSLPGGQWEVSEQLIFNTTEHSLHATTKLRHVNGLSLHYPATFKSSVALRVSVTHLGTQPFGKERLLLQQLALALASVVSLIQKVKVFCLLLQIAISAVHWENRQSLHKARLLLPGLQRLHSSQHEIVAFGIPRNQ